MKQEVHEKLSEEPWKEKRNYKHKLHRSFGLQKVHSHKMKKNEKAGQEMSQQISIKIKTVQSIKVTVKEKWMKIEVNRCRLGNSGERKGNSQADDRELPGPAGHSRLRMQSIHNAAGA